MGGDKNALNNFGSGNHFLLWMGVGVLVLFIIILIVGSIKPDMRHVDDVPGDGSEAGFWLWTVFRILTSWWFR